MVLNALLIATRSCYWANGTKFIFVPIGLSLKKILQQFSFFNFLRLLNVILIQEFRSEIEVFSYNPFLPKSVYKLSQHKTTRRDFFPDKLLNLHGYKYKFCFYVFSTTIAAHQNANVVFLSFESRLRIGL